MIPYEKKLLEIMEKDDSVMAVTAENRALLRNLPPVIGDRFLDTGITESTMIGMSAGLALRGRKPVVHALASFLTMRAFEFIRTDVGIPNLPVKIMGFVPGLLSDGNGPTHQAIEDIALMRGIPGMKVFSPADEEELLQFLPEVVASDSPVYVRLNLRKAEAAHKETRSFEQAEVFGDSGELTLLAHGYMFWEAHKVWQELEKRGFKGRLVNVRGMEPIDSETIVPILKESKHIVTIEDHFLRGGLNTAVKELMADNQVTANVLGYGFDQKWYKPGRLADVMKCEGLDAESIVASLMSKIA